MATIKEEVLLYGGKVNLTFYPTSHQYRVDGKRLPSVTAITGQIDKSRALLGWSERLASEYLSKIELEGKQITRADWTHAITLYKQKKDEGGDIGTEVHNWIDEWISLSPEERTKKELPKDEIVLNGIIAFLNWVKQYDVKFIENERLIYSKKYKYVGKMDNVYTMGSEEHKIIHIGDFKTSNYVGCEAILQTVGYAIAYNEEMKTDYEDLCIQHLNKKTGDFRLIEFKMTPSLKQGFIALTKLKQAVAEANKLLRKK